MILINVTLAKVLLLVFSLLLLFHILLLEKTYSVSISDNNKNYKLEEVTYDQYQSCLNSIPSFEGKVLFISETRTKNILNLPNNSIYGIYFGYFLLVILFISSSKFYFKNGNNGK